MKLKILPKLAALASVSMLAVLFLPGQQAFAAAKCYKAADKTPLLADGSCKDIEQIVGDGIVNQGSNNCYSVYVSGTQIARQVSCNDKSTPLAGLCLHDDTTRPVTASDGTKVPNYDQIPCPAGTAATSCLVDGVGNAAKCSEVIANIAKRSTITAPPPPSLSPGGPSTSGNGSGNGEFNGDNLGTGNSTIDENTPLYKDYLLPAINLLSVGVVALAAIFFVVAGIQYSAGRDNPQMISAAKARIVNVLVGLIAYLFIYGFLQFIIPGGFF